MTTTLLHRLAALDAARDRMRTELAEAQWREIRNGEMMMQIGDIVEVGPNTAAFHGAPHFEPVWRGRVTGFNRYTVDVLPLDGVFVLTVLNDRILANLGTPTT